jgi:hypothetical protein
MIKKFLCSLSLLTLACATGPAGADSSCKPVKIAEAEKCVQDQLEPLRGSTNFNETSKVDDNEDGTKTVTFVFEPKCLHGPNPCRVANRVVTAVVDCAARSATCQQ